MANTITFEITDNQAKKFEQLLDKFNALGKASADRDNNKEKEMSKIQAETHLLLTQAREELKKIKQINGKREKMIWEQ